MALIACPECKATISDKAPACPHCGAPVAVESKLIVSGLMQALTITTVRIDIGSREVARVRQGELVTIPIDHECTVDFVWVRRRASLLVRVGEVTRVQLSVNRMSARLVAQRVEAFTSGAMV